MPPGPASVSQAATSSKSASRLEYGSTKVLNAVSSNNSILALVIWTIMPPQKVHAESRPPGCPFLLYILQAR